LRVRITVDVGVLRAYLGFLLASPVVLQEDSSSKLDFLL
jgi:hypothetical protein